MARTDLDSRFPEILIELQAKMEETVKHGAEMVEDRAKSRVAVESGDLRDAIHTDRIGDMEYSVIAGDSNVFYGHLVEHGTVHSAPEPFLVPALHESTDEILSIAKAALKTL